MLKSNFLCRSELEGWAESGELTRLCVATSREEPTGSDATCHRYVQDFMKAEASSVYRSQIVFAINAIMYYFKFLLCSYL